MIEALFTIYMLSIAPPITDYLPPFLGDRDHIQEELTCLTKNIYHEARGEFEEGRIAVGLVTLERVQSPHYPNSICEVVHQPYAFSWTNDSVKLKQKDTFTMNCITSTFKALSIKSFKLDTLQADHYHNETVYPYWASEYKLVATIGNHKFYKR